MVFIKSAAQNFVHLLKAIYGQILSHNTVFLMSLFIQSKALTSEQYKFMISKLGTGYTNIFYFILFSFVFESALAGLE